MSEESYTFGFGEMRLVPHEEVVALLMQGADYRKAHRIQQPAFDFSQQMYERRKLLGMTHAQIGDAAGLPTRAVEKANEAGSVKLVTLARIAEALGCHIKLTLVPNESVKKEDGGEG